MSGKVLIIDKGDLPSLKESKCVLCGVKTDQLQRGKVHLFETSKIPGKDPEYVSYNYGICLGQILDTHLFERMAAVTGEIKDAAKKELGL